MIQVSVDPKLFSDIDGICFTPSKDMSSLSTLKLKVKGQLLEVLNITGLSHLLRVLNRNKIAYRVLGGGANQVLPECEETLYLKLSFGFDTSYLEQVQPEYTLPASVPLAKLTSHASRFGLRRWEVFTGIPGTIGGATYMNAGTGLGEIRELISSVKIMNIEGVERSVEIEEDSFSYRKNHFVKEGEVITEVKLINFGIDPEVTKTIKNYLKKRNETQPMKAKTCGCVFKNISTELPAGKLIDLLGLKGWQYGSLRISPIHGNFIENLGDANADDFKVFLNLVKDELKLHYAKEFEFEVIL